MLIRYVAGGFALLLMVALGANTAAIEVDITPSRGNAGGAVERQVQVAEEPPQEAPPAESTERRRIEPPYWLAWVLFAMAAAAALWLFASQRFRAWRGRRRRPPERPASRRSERESAAAIAGFAQDLIGELELGDDPRTAILRAYAAVETGFGTRELARRPAETPLRYLDRVFGRRRAAAPALEVLTKHFQVARFSTEPVTDKMRTDAIDALSDIRDRYRSRHQVTSR